MTLKNVLNMRSGLRTFDDMKDNYVGITKMFKSNDPI